MALPTPTVLGVAGGYIPAQNTRYIFAPSVASLSAPTSAEITAGSDLTKLISNVEGFNGQGSTLDFQNASSRLVPKISGMIQMNDSKITLNRDLAGTDAHALFDDGTTGNTATLGVFIIAETGLDSTSKKLQCFRVECTSVQPSRDITAARLDDIMFAVHEIGPVVSVPNA